MFRQIREFLALEAASGILLLAALLIVLIIANTPLDFWYQKLVHFPIGIYLGPVEVHKPLEAWINEGLMAIFFMLLALEMKREVLAGELSKPSRLMLPIITAIAGMVLPVIIFLLLADKNAVAIRGWAIPTTTDIALVLGIMAMLGKRVPPSLKVMVIALSIVDDIVAIALIAIYYSKDLSLYSLMLAGLGCILLVLLNLANVRKIAAYVLVGIFIWFTVLKSGVHATLAGIIVGYCIPYKSVKGFSPLKHLEHTLHPWVAFLIMPVFVLINAGIRFVGIPVHLTFSATPMAIAAGLFFGKQLGIFITAWLLIKFTRVRMPNNATWLQLYGTSVLTGIGFTMSVFISTLAYSDSGLDMLSKQGILIGSLASALWGVFILLIAKKKPRRR